MPYGNANQIERDMAGEVLTAVTKTPVLAGVCGTDPFMIRPHFLRELRDLGYSGIQNFPTVGLIDGMFRANLEETGMGFGLEIDLIAAASELDLLTTPLCLRPGSGGKADRRGCRHHRCTHGPDNVRQHRSSNQPDSARMRAAGQGNSAGCSGSPQ